MASNRIISDFHGLADRAKKRARRLLGAEGIGVLKSAGRRIATAVSVGTARQARLAQDAWDRGDAVTAERRWRALVIEQPRSPSWPLKLSLVARERADYEEAEKILLDARDRGATSADLDLEIEHYSRWRRQSNRAIEDALATVQDPAASPYRLFYAAVYLSSEGLLAPARAGLRRLAGQRRLGHNAQAQLAALDLLEAASPEARPFVPGWMSPSRNSIVVREPSSDTVVVALAPPGGLFGVTVNALHAMLAPAGVNAIYLYDSRQLFHLGGSDRFGPGYGALVDGLKSMVQEMGVRKIVTLGASATGYTAIRLGLDLEAEGVVAFSPLTAMGRPTQVDPRMPHMRHRLREHVIDMMMDLKPELEARQVCKRIEIYYGGDNADDCRHAAHLAGIVGIVFHRLDGLDQHDSVSGLVLNGGGNILRGFGVSRGDSAVG